MTSAAFVIVGAGLAGAQAVAALREQGFDGRITLIGAEPQLPYQRPPLSKEFLAAKKSSIARAYDEADQRLTLADFTVYGTSWYRSHDVDLRLGTQATALHPPDRSVSLADGTVVGYDKLLLATGARPRRPAIRGADADGVRYLRTVDDAAALDAALSGSASLTVVGAGWLGLEVAASARLRGLNVTVIGRSELPLAGVLGSENAAVFAELHRANGVDLRLGTEVAAIAASGVTLADGSHVGAGPVLVAAGAQPNSELAERAGLAIEPGGSARPDEGEPKLGAPHKPSGSARPDEGEPKLGAPHKPSGSARLDEGEPKLGVPHGPGGVLVDSSLRTSDPDIFAVGDVAAVQHPVLGTTIRGAHWADARKQPAIAAAGMLGRPAEYTDLPYFFTDQFDLGMEYIGHAPDYHRVIFRGDVDTRNYIAFWLDAEDRVLAGMNVNVPGVIGDLKRIVQAQTPIAPAHLADPQLPLDALLPSP